jgi:hypothetical protein
VATAPTHLVNHWVHDSNWTGSRTLWAVYATFDAEPALHELAARHRAVLRRVDALDLVQDRWLHATIYGLQFNDAMTADEASSIFDTAMAELPHRPTRPMKLTSAVTDRDAVCWPLEDARFLFDLRDAVARAGLTASNGRPMFRLPEPVGGFNPHITIGYANESIPKHVLAPLLQGLGRIELDITEFDLSLIELQRADRTWTWTTLRREPIRRPDKLPAVEPVVLSPEAEGDDRAHPTQFRRCSV